MGTGTGMAAGEIRLSAVRESIMEVAKAAAIRGEHRRSEEAASLCFWSNCR